MHPRGRGECGDELAGAVEAIERVFCESLAEGVFDVRRQLTDQLARGWDRLVDVRKQHRGRRLGLEWDAPREHLVGDDSQRITV